MALPKYLLQRREGYEDCIYLWTPTLAARKDMMPVAEDVAESMLNGSYKKEAPETKKSEEPVDDKAENPITSSVREVDDEVEESEKHPSMRTQDDMLTDEIRKIKKFRRANTLESYILEKYKIDLIPSDLENMRDQALSIVTELADHGKLFDTLK